MQKYSILTLPALEILSVPLIGLNIRKESNEKSTNHWLFTDFGSAQYQQWQFRMYTLYRMSVQWANKVSWKKIEEIQITGVSYDPKPFGGPARITFWLVHILFVVEISQRASPKRCYLTFLSGWYRSFINVFQKEDNWFSQVGKAISVEELNFFVSQKKFAQHPALNDNHLSLVCICS